MTQIQLPSGSNSVRVPHDFTGRSLTVSGARIKSIEYNPTMNVWLGMVWDEKSFRRTIRS